MKKSMLLAAMLMILAVPVVAQVPMTQSLTESEKKLDIISQYDRKSHQNGQYENGANPSTPKLAQLGDCWYDPDDTRTINEDSNIPIIDTPCGIIH